MKKIQTSNLCIGGKLVGSPVHETELLGCLFQEYKNLCKETTFSGVFVLEF